VTWTEIPEVSAVNESFHLTLRDQAHAAIVTMITTGRQVPVALEDTATVLRADLSKASLRYGVQPGEWQATTGLPTARLDVLVIVEARHRDH
jgi:tartrate dehydratase beta subunit/fumarate hydratase class I family protein